MKRGGTGEADKHVIRRKVDEHWVLIREQRKVRERLSRECADTLRHIAATKAAINQMKGKHKEKIKEEREDFMHVTAIERREIHRQQERRAELERILSSSEIIEREHLVLTERLEALRIDNEKEATENARAMDTLKRNLFNVRNELENVFRTTLHDLNVAYQGQAFDSMVQEAAMAKEELPSLRQKLCRKTRDVSGIITRQASSYQGEKQAKLSKDMAEVTNRMQGNRTAKLRRKVEDQKESVARTKAEVKELGDKLDAFQIEAEERRAATTELRQLRAESARKKNECLQIQLWAHTLAKQGPRALKAQMKRQRLADATTSTLACFFGSSESRTGTVSSKSLQQNENDETSAESNPASVPQRANSHDDDKVTEYINKNNNNNNNNNNNDCDRARERRDTSALASLVASSGRHRAVIDQEFQVNSTRVQPYLQKETKRGGMSAGQEVRIGGADGEESFGLCHSVYAPAEEAIRQMPRLMENGGAIEEDSSDKGTGVHISSTRRGGEENAVGEDVWRASLSGHHHHHQKQPPPNSTSDDHDRDHCPREGVVVVAVDDDRGGSDETEGKHGFLLKSKANNGPEGRFFNRTTENRMPTTTATTTSSIRTKTAADSITQQSVSSSKKNFAVGRAPEVWGEGGSNMLPEVIAKILLSECNVTGGKAYENVLKRARQGVTDPATMELGKGYRTTLSPPLKALLQPSQQLLFPDVPYGFTEIGRRVNGVENHSNTGSGAATVSAKSHLK